MSMKHALEVLNEFCNFAGSKININKTECILLGTLKNLYDELYGIKTTNKAVRCLGIFIGHDKVECYNKNWMKVYHDVEKLFESWKRRKLTLFVKSCIINTLALSKLTYIASILNSPENDFIKKIQRLIYNFIWDKTERIKRNTLIGNVLKGGLAVVDIECKIKALKASWVPRLLKNKNILYKIFDSYCKQINIDVNYALQFSEKKIENMQKLGKLPMFYQQVLCSFNECKPKNSENISSIKIVQQPIWNNCNFLYKGNSLFF